ncbi:MAG: hypothetical protein QOE59_1623 [Actinomycetota bacterium]|jgi:hypothetical protein|nr:hypothetical protein [Actinomycetota bacterium]
MDARVHVGADAAELRLVTCGGPLDRGAHDYLGQTVVDATEV